MRSSRDNLRPVLKPLLWYSLASVDVAVVITERKVLPNLEY